MSSIFSISPIFTRENTSHLPKIKWHFTGITNRPCLSKRTKINGFEWNHWKTSNTCLLSLGLIYECKDASWKSSLSKQLKFEKIFFPSCV